MKLVNQTGLHADATLAELPGFPVRIGLLSAKATFVLDDSGAATLDTQDAHPMHPADVVTDYGIVPPDFAPRRTGTVEVFLVGKAHADGGRPTRAMRVAIELGAERRELLVFGDRHWVGEGSRATPSEPMPFVEMPLSWDRAFGGSSEIFVDRDNSIPVLEQWNPLGKGFDAASYLPGIRDAVGAAPGYPLLHPAYQRLLPNLEHPSHRIERWADAPDPWCFSTVPMTVPYAAKPMADRVPKDGSSLGDDAALPESLVELLAPRYAERWDEMFYRSHPAMRFAAHVPFHEIGLEGVFRGRSRVHVRLPRIEVLADYVVGPRSGTKTLLPQMLVILPEENRITVTYRLTYSAEPMRGLERSFRLRVNTL